MIITTELIKSLNPCKGRWDNFLEQYGHFWKGTHREFAKLDKISYKDKVWVLSHLMMLYNIKADPISLRNFSPNIDDLCCQIDRHEKALAPPKEEVKFRVGDIVEWGGARGKVTVVFNESEYPIRCSFDRGTIGFMEDGRYFNWHKDPSLKLIERPKKKVKKYKVLYKRGDEFLVSIGLYVSEDEFIKYSAMSGDKFIQLIKESEVEVEE